MTSLPELKRLAESALPIPEPSDREAYRKYLGHELELQKAIHPPAQTILTLIGALEIAMTEMKCFCDDGGYPISENSGHYLAMALAEIKKLVGET